ncbi:MAG: hypothetical protein HN348_20725, partial [Proteobacteria bacterium]|nr:hypothetical protein [Pseudomonadota bacterium]
DDGLVGVINGVAPGTAMLMAQRNDKVIDEILLTFAKADNVVFVPGAMERLGLEAQTVSSPQVVTAGRASFRVVLRSGNAPVYGVPYILVTPPQDLDVLVDEYYGDALGPWLWLEPYTTQAVTLDLQVNEDHLVPFTVKGIDSADVATIEVFRQSEAAAEEGDILGATTMGRTENGNRVYGLPVTWMLDGDNLGWGADYFDNPGASSETYWYEYIPDVNRLLEAEYAGHSDGATIHGVPMNDSCDSCSATGRSGSLWTLGLALVVGWRRRSPMGNDIIGSPSFASCGTITHRHRDGAVNHCQMVTKRHK